MTDLSGRAVVVVATVSAYAVNADSVFDIGATTSLVVLARLINPGITPRALSAMVTYWAVVVEGTFNALVVATEEIAQVEKYLPVEIGAV